MWSAKQWTENYKITKLNRMTGVATMIGYLEVFESLNKKFL